jgi:hypothetical protein
LAVWARAAAKQRGWAGWREYARRCQDETETIEPQPGKNDLG